MRPDTCEPNNVPDQPCRLPLDAVSGPFTFVPEDDRDFYLLDLPLDAAIQTVVTVRGTAGLDLWLTAHQGATLLASDAYSFTLTPEISGPVLLRVENRAPGLSIGESYRIEVRRTIVPPTQIEDAIRPDLLENNWSFADAPTIAVGVVYDLNLVCPDPRPGACPGGDHDHLLVPVKAGVTYMLATFDLDPGLDTVLELFWGDSNIPIVGNDDYGPGGMLSALHWTAPADGILRIRIAPRNGGMPIQMEHQTSAYRFAIVPQPGELAGKIEELIRQQANLPVPTITPNPSVAGASTTGGVAASSTPETIAGGEAFVLRETNLRREPSMDSIVLAVLPPESIVTIRGPVQGAWVSVEHELTLLPGWVRWADLQRVGTARPGPDTTVSGTTTAISGSPEASMSLQPTVITTARPTVAAETGPQIDVVELDPILPPPPAVPGPRVPLTLRTTIVASNRPTGGTNPLGLATPTPDLSAPVSGVRLQIVNVFGDLLAEGMTGTDGTVRLSRDVQPDAQLLVRVPAWGLSLPLTAGQETLIITVPEAPQ
jgi:hypothetical protein